MASSSSFANLVADASLFADDHTLFGDDHSLFADDDHSLSGGCSLVSNAQRCVALGQMFGLEVEPEMEVDTTVDYVSDSEISCYLEVTDEVPEAMFCTSGGMHSLSSKFLLNTACCF